MNFKIGDNVKFIDDIGEGTISKIIDHETVLVHTSDGFDIPVLTDDIIKIEAESQEQIYKKTEIIKQASDTVEKESIKLEQTQAEQECEPEPESEPVPEPVITPDISHTKILLAFVPLNAQKPTSHDLYLFLINDSNYFLLYNIRLKEKNKYSFIDAGTLEPNTKIAITQYKREELNKLRNYFFQFIFLKKDESKPVPPVEKELKLRPIKFFLSINYKENDYFDEPAVIFPIIEEKQEIKIQDCRTELHKTKPQKVFKPDTPPFISKNKKNKEQEIIEVDLHINKLIKDYKGLTNSEILHIQILKFRSTLESCLARNVAKVVFIHGIGNGTLKLEIRKILDTEYSNLKYQDASFKKYGYGATMVILK